MKISKHITKKSTLENLQAQTYRLGLRTTARIQSVPSAFWMGVGLVLLSGTIPDHAMAALPTSAADVVPDSVGADSDGLTMGVRIMQIVFQGVAAALGMFAVLIPAASMIKSYRNRKGNDNDEFHSTVVGGLFVMVVGLGLALTGWTYSNGLATQILALN